MRKLSRTLVVLLRCPFLREIVHREISPVYDSNQGPLDLQTNAPPCTHCLCDDKLVYIVFILLYISMGESEKGLSVHK